MKKKNENETLHKLTAGIVTFVVLCICFTVTTFALVYAIVTVENNVFETGFVDINLNDGEAVINDSHLYFEPGMKIQKDFFIENGGPRAVYYKLYLNALTGDLAQVLRIKIVDKTDENNITVLYDDIADELRRFNVEAVDRPLGGGERRELQIEFYLEEGASNDYQSSNMTFDLCADAVQADNNPDKEFNETTAPNLP